MAVSMDVQLAVSVLFSIFLVAFGQVTDTTVAETTVPIEQTTAATTAATTTTQAPPTEPPTPIKRNTGQYIYE